MNIIKQIAMLAHIISMILLIACEQKPANYTINKEVEGQGEVHSYAEISETESGTNITITAIPKEGFYFSKWEGDIESVENPYTVKNIDQNYTIKGVFVCNPKIQFNSEGSGEIICSNATSNDSYKFKSSITLTANPKVGWKFVGWKGDAISSDSSLTIQCIKKSYKLTAVFEPGIDESNQI